MKQIEIIFDFLCPFCYKQLLVFHALRKDGYSFELKPIPYLLQSDTPMEGSPFSKKEKEEALNRLQQIQTQNSLFHSVSFTTLTHSYNTYPSHLLALGVYKLGDYLSFALDVFSTYFEGNQNISSMDVLTPLLTKQNLSLEQVMGAVNADDMRKAIHYGFQTMKDSKAEAVPILVFPEEKVTCTSSQSYEQLVSYFKSFS